MQRPGFGEAYFEHHAVGQRRVDITPATGHPTNRRQQQRGVTVFGGIARRTGLQRPRRHLCLIVHRQHQDRWSIVQRTDTRDRLQAVHTRHRDIQQYHLARCVAQGFEQLLAITGLPRHLHVLGQANQLLDAFTDNGVVFGHQYSNHDCSPTPTEWPHSGWCLRPARFPASCSPPASAPARAHPPGQTRWAGSARGKSLGHHH
ncbi:hypothetical protein D3C80_637700 [compost metagenome]